MDAQATILIIDDNTTSRKFASRALIDSYQVECAENAALGLQMAEEMLPQAILMDVEMPGMNGYEACDILRRTASTQHIPVVFISSLGTLRARMQGYESGGNDYLVKPFEQDELLAKLQLLLDGRATHSKLSTQAGEAQKVALEAMTGSHELGQAMLLLEKCQEAHQYAELAQHLLNFTNNMGLNCSLVIQGHNAEHPFSSSGETPPLEAEVIRLLRNDQRIHDFGSRTQINFPMLSLLVKNMPLDDMERYGRIKDLLPSMLGTLNARIITLNTQQALEQQTLDLMKSFETTRDTLNELGAILQRKQQGSVSILRNMLEKLDEKLPGMGLEDDQEAFILDNIAVTIENVADITDDAEHISATFDSVLAKLEQLIDSQTQLVAAHSPQSAPASKDEADSYSSDIELF